MHKKYEKAYSDEIRRTMSSTQWNESVQQFPEELRVKIEFEMAKALGHGINTGMKIASENSEQTTNNQRILVRPSDLEEFIEVSPGLFSNKKMLEDFPDNLHHKFSYDQLINEAFALKETIQVSKYYVEIYPTVIYYLPSCVSGHRIMVTEDPYEGVSSKLVEES